MNIDIAQLLTDESTDYSQEDLETIFNGRATEDRKAALMRVILASYNRGWAECEEAYKKALAVGLALDILVARA